MNFDWAKIASGVTDFVKATIPFAVAGAEALDPAAKPIIDIGSKIITDLMNAEPAAQALVEQVQSGTPITAAQAATYRARYDTDDDALAADIKEHLDALKPKP